MSQDSLMKSKHSISEGAPVQMGDVETSPKEDVLWTLDLIETYSNAGNTKRVQELLYSIKQLVKHNMGDM